MRKTAWFLLILLLLTSLAAPLAAWVEPAAAETTTPSDAPDPVEPEGQAPGDETPADGEPADSTPERLPGDMTAELGGMDTPVIQRKQKVTVAVPVSLRVGSVYWYTNMVSSGSLVSYSASRASSAYSGEIGQVVDSLTVEIVQNESCPFYTQTIPGAKRVVGTVSSSNYSSFGLTRDTDPAGATVFRDKAGGVYQAGDTVNMGFAVFEDLIALSEVRNGSYTITLQVKWESQLYGNGSSTLSLPATAINSDVETKTTGGGGGVYYGGGGGGGGTTASAPEAKLIVDSASTSPENPSAGQEFDLLLQLSNTSSSQAVQNISLSCEADGDAVLPTSGSFSAYVEKIEPLQTHTVRMHVRAQSDIEDKPIKLYVLIDYEDPTYNSHSSSQTVVVNVAQQMRIKLDDPVQPTDGSIVGETYNVTMGVFNLGRATLYNVTVTGSSESAAVSVGASYYCGNMESGTSKTAEIRFTPLAAGPYTVDLNVSYENGRGEEFSETRSVSFYSTSYEENDWFGEDDLLEPETTPAPSAGQQVLEVMSLLPWWIYAAAGGIFFLVLLGIGSAARRRRIRALEDDEME